MADLLGVQKCRCDESVFLFTPAIANLLDHAQPRQLPLSSQAAANIERARDLLAVCHQFAFPGFRHDVVSLFFSSLGGYALAKYRFRGRNMVMVYMLASMTIPGVVLLAPNFEVIWRLGWMDTYKALIIPGAVSAFGIFLFRQAMLNVPNELLEAARIDGCGEFRIYLTLIMPLVRPMSGAFCLISFMGAWNAFLAPNIFLQSQSKLTLPVVLNQYMGTYVQQYGVFLAGTLVAMIPPAILFFSLQREFISGLTSGAVKQ